MSITVVAERALPLDVIRIDGGTQSRTKIHEDVVETYAANMADGSVFPAAIVFFDGKDSVQLRSQRHARPADVQRRQAAHRHGHAQ